MPRCKICRIKFEPKYFLQKVCLNSKCILSYSKEVKRKQWHKDKKIIKESLKSNADHVRELQKVFNTFIRLRDKDKPCISCNKPLKGKYDAGHFYSTGSYPELRFNEFNVFGQCVYCNQHKRGNLIAYGLNLPDRIGNENILQLRKLSGTPRKYTIPELKELKEYYKEKIKELKKV